MKSDPLEKFDHCSLASFFCIVQEKWSYRILREGLRELRCQIPNSPKLSRTMASLTPVAWFKCNKLVRCRGAMNDRPT